MSDLNPLGDLVANYGTDEDSDRNSAEDLGGLTEISSRQPFSVVGEGTSPQGPGPSGASNGPGASPAGARPNGGENGGQTASAGPTEEDDLQQMLPPDIRDPPPGNLDPKVQATIEGLHHTKRLRGKMLGPELRRKREYTNPYFLQKMVEMYKIDPLGTSFHKDVFDPSGLNPADYYDKLAAELHDLATKKPTKRKSAAEEHALGDRRPATIVIPQSVGGVKISLPLPTSAPRKKTKWDAVPARP